MTAAFLLPAVWTGPHHWGDNVQPVLERNVEAGACICLEFLRVTKGAKPETGVTGKLVHDCVEIIG